MDALSDRVFAFDETDLMVFQSLARYMAIKGSQGRSELAVPIIAKQVIGVLNVLSDRLNGFDDTGQMALQPLLHQLAVAIENIRFDERSQRLAVMEERSRLVRELHDAVT